MKSEKIIKDIGLKVRKKRQQKGISIEELAFKCEVAYSTISNLERGISKDLKASNLISIITFLEIDPAIIFKSSTKNKIDKIESGLKDIVKLVESI